GVTANAVRESVRGEPHGPDRPRRLRSAGLAGSAVHACVQLSLLNPLDPHTTPHCSSIFIMLPLCRIDNAPIAEFEKITTQMAIDHVLKENHFSQKLFLNSRFCGPIGVSWGDWEDFEAASGRAIHASDGSPGRFRSGFPRLRPQAGAGAPFFQRRGP